MVVLGEAGNCGVAEEKSWLSFDNVQDAKCPFAHGRGEVAILTNGSAQQSPGGYRIFVKKVQITKGDFTWRIDEAATSGIPELEP